MGAWSTFLYASDTTSDIRGDYLDMLRRGMTNEEATRGLIEASQGYMGDVEEEPLLGGVDATCAIVTKGGLVKTFL